jgi:hypothetical protein
VSTDRNLLFGVLALQADLLHAAQFAEACSACAARKGTPLADLLLERGWRAAEQRGLVDQLLQQKLQKHAGDAHASLAAVTAPEVRSALHGEMRLGPGESMLLMLHGFNDEDPGRYDAYRSIARTAPLALLVRAKVYRLRSGKETWLDYDRIFKILRQARYNGFVSLVYEGWRDLDAPHAAPDGVKCLRGYLGR